MESGRNRNSNVELLRLIAMLLIIGHHFSVHGGFFFHDRQITGNMLFLQWLSVGGKVGVDLFVLISGYFLIAASEIRIQKAVKLWLQIFFYSVSIFAVFSLSGLHDFSVKGLLEALFPILSKQWWFASSYFVMYLLSPAMNRGLKKLNQKKYLLLLAVQAALWYAVPVFTWLPERLRDLMWFVFLYSISGYLRLHHTAEKRKAGTWLLLGAGMLLLSFGYSVFLLSFLVKYQSTYETAYFQTWQPLLLLTAVFLLLGFLRLKETYNPQINRLAAASFGVYLIHDSNFVRYPLWRDLLRCAAWRDSRLLIPYAIAAIILVYLVCMAVEQVRIALLERRFGTISETVEIRVKNAAKRRNGNS